MRTRRLHSRLSSPVAVLLVTLLLASGAWAGTKGAVPGSHRNVSFKTLYFFTGSSDGAHPAGRVTIGRDGNLFGSTASGGTNDTGTVYELYRDASGAWKERVLYSFGPYKGSDCAFPSSKLMWDPKGNLYGFAANGGANGWGCVFMLSPSGGGGWTESVIYSFGSSAGEGGLPYGSPFMDKAGNLYGTTSYGGTNNDGAVWELSPNGSGGWTFRVLELFDWTNGDESYGGLKMDRFGNLWGNTYYGGAYGDGVVFQLVPDGKGGWSYQIVHSFSGGADGSHPAMDHLVFGADGSAFGTTVEGGAQGCGMVTCGTAYTLVRSGDGTYKLYTIFDFGVEGEGGWPGELRFDKHGHLYGSSGYPPGVLFELVPKRKGSHHWKGIFLHGFDVNDGEGPSGLNTNDNHHFYGVTGDGGTGCPGYGCGTVFEITP